MAGGAPITIAHSDVPYGLSWQGNDILFVPSGQRIMRVSSRGGTPGTVVTFGVDEEGFSAQLLPDGDHVLFTLRSRGADWDSARIVAQSLRSGERKLLVDRGQDARYVSTGHVVYAVGGVLFAMPFDAGRLTPTGAAVPSSTASCGRAGTAATRSGRRHSSASPIGERSHTCPGPAQSPAAPRSVS